MAGKAMGGSSPGQRWIQKLFKEIQHIQRIKVSTYAIIERFSKQKNRKKYLLNDKFHK